MQNLKNLSPVALMHALAHITAVISLGAGAVSFTHIVKVRGGAWDGSSGRKGSGHIGCTT
jgi:hypothetical protein